MTNNPIRRGTTSSAPPGPPPSAASVRRNLFQSQLTRRPTAPPGTTTTSSSSSSSSSSSTQQPASSDLSGDIVVRDQNGEIELGDPPTPPIDDAEEIETLQAEQENERERKRLAEAVKQHHHPHQQHPEGKTKKSFKSLLSSHDKIPTEEDLYIAKPYASGAELLEAVRASLRQKVAALAEDNWMYSREEIPRHP
ncbi:hypothetical protein QBC35DRAFT_379826 [Podospora australis]|uniref:Uncharacterized protein n=1 Tax=Podospora australis TaxID=1536484 RepID=A0AAN6WWE0_9PEZI|nr:hypothetical protein QBC35DRAFT_379826 [Podospora australis]